MECVIKKRIAIVGAGASGITATKQAVDYGFEPITFELSKNVGGLWFYKPYETDESSVMKSTVINTSKEMTAYSDFPPDANVANFMHNQQMLKYLNDYAKFFCLYKYIRFEHKVINIYRSSTYKTDGTWIIEYSNQQNKKNVEEFDAVLICTGHHTEPYIPAPWPNQEKFCGKIIHAHSYKDHRNYEDKVVAVVGVGNSGVDVAVELSRIGKQVYLISRRGTWIFQRNYYCSEPFDLILNRRLIYFFFELLPIQISNKILSWELNRRINHKKYGLKPKHGIFAAHWTVNDEILNRLSCGTVRVKPNIKSFTETGINFEDGSKAENVDEVNFY